VGWLAVKIALKPQNCCVALKLGVSGAGRVARLARAYALVHSGLQVQPHTDSVSSVRLEGGCFPLHAASLHSGLCLQRHALEARQGSCGDYLSPKNHFLLFDSSYLITITEETRLFTITNIKPNIDMEAFALLEFDRLCLARLQAIYGRPGQKANFPCVGCGPADLDGEYELAHARVGMLFLIRFQ